MNGCEALSVHQETKTASASGSQNRNKAKYKKWTQAMGYTE